MPVVKLFFFFFERVPWISSFTPFCARRSVSPWAIRSPSIEECREKETLDLRSHIAGQLLSPEQVAARVPRFVAVCVGDGEDV